jgi:hypothetical protein
MEGEIFQASSSGTGTKGVDTGLGTRNEEDITKDGILYKKRDHFNEYPPRYFLLKNSILSYYRNYNEQPIRSIVIDKNIVVKSDPTGPSTSSSSSSFYLFQIYQKNMTTQLQLIYTLGTKTDIERINWIQELEKIIFQSQTKKNSETLTSSSSSAPIKLPHGVTSPISSHSTTQTGPGGGSSSVTDHNPLSQISTIVEPENPDATYLNLSEPLRKKIDSVAYAILTLSNELPIPDPTFSTATQQQTPPSQTGGFKKSPSTTNEWDLIYSKNNILGYRKSNSGVVCVRGETILPYTIPEICSLTNQWTREIEPNLDSYERLNWLSKHTSIEHIKYKPIWPTLPRDFVNMSHWRVLRQDPNRVLATPQPTHTDTNTDTQTDHRKDSKYFLNFSFSEQSIEEEYCRPLEGYVRGSVLVGYVMKHVTGGTKVIFIIQVTSSSPLCLSPDLSLLSLSVS